MKRIYEIWFNDSQTSEKKIETIVETPEKAIVHMHKLWHSIYNEPLIAYENGEIYDTNLNCIYDPDNISMQMGRQFEMIWMVDKGPYVMMKSEIMNPHPDKIKSARIEMGANYMYEYLKLITMWMPQFISNENDYNRIQILNAMNDEITEMLVDLSGPYGLNMDSIERTFPEFYLIEWKKTKKP